MWIVLFARARSDWLTRRWLAKYYSPTSCRRETKWLRVSVSEEDVISINASHSACMLYTKTVIHLIVGSVNIHHHSPPLRWIIVTSSIKESRKTHCVQYPHEPIGGYCLYYPQHAFGEYHRMVLAWAHSVTWCFSPNRVQLKWKVIGLEEFVIEV